MKKHLLTLIWLVCFQQAFSQTLLQSKIDSLRFPRIAGCWTELKNEQLDDTTVVNNISKFPLAILPINNTIFYIQHIRQLNPKIIILPIANPKMRDRNYIVDNNINLDWIVQTAGSVLLDSLSADISDTILYVQNAKKFRQSAPFGDGSYLNLNQFLRIDNEIMIIDSVDTITNRIFVSRSANMVTSHQIGARVRAIVTRWPTQIEMNLSEKCPLSSNGKKWADKVLNENRNNIILRAMPSGNYMFDGVLYDLFTDVMSDVSASYIVQDGSQDVDLDLDGVADNPDSLDLWWHNGLSAYISRLRDLAQTHRNGEFLIIANDQSELAEVLNGRLFEQFPYNPTYGCSKFGGWEKTMSLYHDWMIKNSNPLPRVSIINSGEHTQLHDSTNYRYMRFSLASSLMQDGFFYHDEGTSFHNTFWWYDEYAVDSAGHATTDASKLGWLGYSIEEARQVYAGSEHGTGVWERKFQNGIAIVGYLPKDIEVTVQLDTLYKRIKGITDTVWNDGSGPFNSVTLTANQLSGVPFAQGTMYGVGAILWGKSSVTTSVNQIPVIRGYNLEQNYPNPFNSSTTIRFSFPRRKHVTLKVFDVLGREVATLVDEEKPAGVYEVTFDASKLSSGIYLYKIQAGSFVQTRKMLLLK